MKKDIVYLVTKHGDKNNAIELWSDDKNKVQSLNDIFNEVTASKRFPMLESLKHNKYYAYASLEIFRQGYNDHWIMLETWTSKEDLMIEFGEFCAKELGLPFDII